MKQKYLFCGILSAGLVFMMVLAGCDYNGPSANEIADTVTERIEVRVYSDDIESLGISSGKLTIGKGITAWGQTNAAYTLVVNTAERLFFTLPANRGLVWEGNGTDDIKRTDSYITLAEKSDGKSAAFNFTITNSINTTKTVKGVLTVTTRYDPGTVGVATLNVFFEKVLSYGLDDETAIFTTDKPITGWGQTDAAYTITADIYEGNNIRIYSPNAAPVLYLQTEYSEWENAAVDWKPPVLGDLTGDISNSYLSGNIYIDGNYLYLSDYRGTTYSLSTDSTTAKEAKFEFRVTRDDQTISGTVTVNIKKITKTPEQIQEEAEKAQLVSLRNTFNNRFTPSFSSYYGGVVSRYIDKDITAFGQTDVLYTISVCGGSTNSEIDGDGNRVYYGNVTLPSIYGYDASDNYTNFITWETKTADENGAVVLNTSGISLKVYTGKTGTAEFSFTYTNPEGKTVAGTVNVTVIK